MYLTEFRRLVGLAEQKDEPEWVAAASPEQKANIGANGPKLLKRIVAALGRVDKKLTYVREPIKKDEGALGDIYTLRFQMQASDPTPSNIKKLMDAVVAELSEFKKIPHWNKTSLYLASKDQTLPLMFVMYPKESWSGDNLEGVISTERHRE